MKKSISIILLTTILLPSCIVYQKTSVPINKAYDMGKVKLINTSGKEIVFNNIEKIDSMYYGDYKSLKVLIPPADVEVIYLYDKKKSDTKTLITTAAILLTPPILIFIAFAIWY